TPMKTSLRIAIADDEPRMREFYQEMLPLLGHVVISVSATGAELVAACRTQPPDLVITDIRMPDKGGIDAAAEIWDHEPVPIIMVSAHDDAELLERAAVNHVLGYMVKPIKRQDLQPAILIAAHRFEEFQSLRKEATDLRQALEDRKLIERAKGILMRRTGEDEAAAFRHMQKLARDSNRKLV